MGILSMHKSLQYIKPFEQFINESEIDRSLPCVPELFRLPMLDMLNLLGPSRSYASKPNILILKTALGVIGRESDFGQSDRYKYLNPLKVLWGFVGGQTSIGLGQIKPESLGKSGIIAIVDLNTAHGALKGVYSILLKNYAIAIETGYSSDAPSINFNSGTGNAALDIAISAFNMGATKIVKHCETDNPNLKRNCSLAGTKTKDGLTVTDKYVANYLPNYKTTRWDGVNISSHGYVKEVAETIKKMTCF